MPNLGYVLDGYDIFYGNPLSTGTAGATPDPGFRDGIFNATYHGKVTPDDMYSVPELIKSMTDSFTHLRHIQELMEYGFVGMRTLKFFNG